jgi:putative two-component system response regulator
MSNATETLESHDQFSDLDASIDVGIRICQTLYSQGRSSAGKHFALALNKHRDKLSTASARRRTATAGGLLSMYSGDFPTALELHSAALQYSVEIGTADELTRALNNVGSAWLHAGCYGTAAETYQRAVAAAERDANPLFSRYSALTNLAQCNLYLGDIESGSSHAQLAFEEIERAPNLVDDANRVLLHRNTVRLLLESGCWNGAQEHAGHAKALADKEGSMKARIAASLSQALVDIAAGHHDIARTRLEHALRDSRYLWADLRDTLACVVRAEEQLGAPARAMVRLRELSDLLHRRIEESVQQACDIPPYFAAQLRNETQRANGIRNRLVGQLARPSIPDTWSALLRMSVGHSLQFDPTGQHGHRVGTLASTLAQAIGIPALEALEIGHAAKLHDIGIAVGHETLLTPHPDWREPNSPALSAHCRGGGNILSDATHPRMLLAQDMALYHHAAWDGHGHPEGISGMAIPLHARICAVADSFDSLMHPPPGTKSPKMTDALAKLRTLAGTQLDPTLVHVFVTRISEDAEAHSVDVSADDGMSGFFNLVSSLSSRRFVF